MIKLIKMKKDHKLVLGIIGGGLIVGFYALITYRNYLEVKKLKRDLGEV